MIYGTGTTPDIDWQERNNTQRDKFDNFAQWHGKQFCTQFPSKYGGNV